MTTRTVFVSAALLAALVFVSQSTARGADESPSLAAGKTLDNLQAAYNGESNANARYLAFAKQADKEGYGQVASLFRAAANAEAVHAAAHAKVIKSLGADPKADIKDPDIKSTRENLQVALAGEIYERDTMYPQFIKEAREQKNSAAIRTFNLAKTAEAEHAKLYQLALDNLDQWRDGKKTFYVCQVCGYTTTTLPLSRCISCREPVENYKTVD